MIFFRKKFSAKSLAMVLIRHSTCDPYYQSADDGFCLGPHGISVADGPKVLSRSEIRSTWEQMDSRDQFVIELEGMYLRGFVAKLCVEAFIKSAGIRESVVSRYLSFWQGWSAQANLNYKDCFEKACVIYGVTFSLNSSDQKAVAQAIGRDFANACNPFGLLGPEIELEVAARGASIFSKSADDLTQLFENTLSKYRLTED